MAHPIPIADNITIKKTPLFISTSGYTNTIIDNTYNTRGKTNAISALKKGVFSQLPLL